MAATKAQIAALYVGYFNRGADPEGLNYWLSQTTMSVVEIANSFAVQPEAKATYAFLATPNLQSIPAIDQFVTEVYQNVFERAPDQAGLVFWRNEILNGKPPGRVVVDIESGAQGDDKIILDRKTEVSAYYADKFALSGDTPWTVEKDLPNAADALEGDRAFWLSANAVTDAKAHVDVLVAESFDTVFDLTIGVDNYTGGPGVNVFNAALAVGIDGLVAVQTLQGADTLTGGGLEDTLNAELNNTGTTHNPTMTGIEVYNLTSFAGPIFGSGNLDLDRASGYEQLWNRDSRADLTLINVRVDAEGNAPILGLSNVRESTYDVSYDDVEVGTQFVVVDNVGTVQDDVNLDISGIVDENGLPGEMDTMELVVSGGVYLELEGQADGMSHLVIEGSGVLQLEGDHDFANLVTLLSTGYTGDLSLDVGRSLDLESVLTGVGNDRIEVNHAVVDGGLEVDLGAGVNTLAIDSGSWWDLDSDDINGLDFTGGTANVQILAFDDDVELNKDAVLDLTGFDTDLTTIAFDEDLQGNGHMLTIADSPNTALLMDVEGSLDWLHLNTGNLVDLTIDVAGAELDIDSLHGPVDGGGDDLPAVLKTLSLIQGELHGEIYLDVNGLDNVGALEVVTANGNGDIYAEFDASANDADLDALKTIDLTATDDIELILTGNDGITPVAGVRASQTFEISVTGTVGLNSVAAGHTYFTSGSLPVGFVDAAYSTGPYIGSTNVLHDIEAAFDIANAFDAQADISATSFLNTFTVVWDDFGPVNPLAYQSALSGSSSGSLNSVAQIGSVAGVAEVEMVPGTGFDSLETIKVAAGVDDDADLEITDVYGQFILDASAGDDIYVDLFNTQATAVTLVAGDDIDLDIGGDTIGNWDLEVVTVEGLNVDVDMNDNLESFTTLDARSVTGTGSSLILDVSDADYGAGSIVTYMIGDTGTVTSDANGAREIWAFDGTDIGNVMITGFNEGPDPSIGDRLDLSAFGITGAGQLVFTNAGGNLEITSLGEAKFDGTITLVGLAGDAADVANFNIIYA